MINGMPTGSCHLRIPCARRLAQRGPRSGAAPSAFWCSNNFMGERGVVLVTVLILLIILSLLSVSALAVSNLELRMSRNLEEVSQMFEAAEAGLKEGEVRLVDDQIFYHMNTRVNYSVKQAEGVFCVVSEQGKFQGFVYRVTAQASHGGSYLLGLQSTYAKSVGLPCQEGDKLVHAGRMSWRQL